MVAAVVNYRSLLDVPDHILFCNNRSFGHQWDRFQPLRLRRGIGTLVPLRCNRCTTERWDTFDSTGALVHRSYDHCDGYTLKNLAVDQWDIRKECIRRMKKGQRLVEVDGTG